MNLTASTFPFNAHDVKFFDSVNYYGYQKMYLDEIRKEDMDHEKVVSHLASALSMVTGISDEEYVDNFPLDLDGDNLSAEEGLYKYYVIELGHKLSMRRVHAHMHNVFNTHTDIKGKAQSYSTVIDGKSYRLNLKLWEDFILEDESGYELFSGPSIECLRLNQIFENGIEPLDENYDIEHHLKRGLSFLSYLLVYDGEKFPMGKAERTAYVNTKNEGFRDHVTLGQVNEVIFFLTSVAMKIQLKWKITGFGTARREIPVFLQKETHN